MPVTLTIKIRGKYMEKEKLVKQAEAAEYLGLSPRTLAKARSTGFPAFPFVRLGGAIRYSKEDLEAYVMENKENNVKAKSIVEQ
jgi:excisionase family DNA binding protein|tara:strand:- start:1139 stop:1390 length:252 start_codon:yes stop_codon:yes gene_type:complete